MNQFTHIVGLDECGYGSLAGPVVVCGVKAPTNWTLEGLNDSKQLSDKKLLFMNSKLMGLMTQRDIDAEQIMDDLDSNCLSYHIASRSSQQIDQHGISWALKDAYEECVRALIPSPDPAIEIITDGTLKFDRLKGEGYDVRSVIKADTFIPAVMAASILGKSWRDAWMIGQAPQYSGYDFENNVGYGSKKHMAAIQALGPSALHRMSYAPMKNMKK